MVILLNSNDIGLTHTGRKYIATEEDQRVVGLMLFEGGAETGGATDRFTVVDRLHIVDIVEVQDGQWAASGMIVGHLQ